MTFEENPLYNLRDRLIDNPTLISTEEEKLSALETYAPILGMQTEVVSGTTWYKFPLKSDSRVKAVTACPLGAYNILEDRVKSLDF